MASSVGGKKVEGWRGGCKLYSVGRVCVLECVLIRYVLAYPCSYCSNHRGTGGSIGCVRDVLRGYTLIYVDVSVERICVDWKHTHTHAAQTTAVQGRGGQ